MVNKFVINPVLLKPKPSRGVLLTKMLKVSLKPGYLRLSYVSIAVMIFSVALRCWFNRNIVAEKRLNLSETATGGKENEESPYRLHRIDPVEVGYVRELNLVPGKVHTMRTLSLRPTLFEIQDFLSEQECDDIIFMAKTQGLERSKTLGEKVPDGEEQSPNRTAERNVPENPAETFLHLDLNADGSMDVAEISQALMELGRVLVDEKITKKIMKDLTMDPNNDGVITYNEFIRLTTESKMKDITHYLEKIHQTKPNKRTRDSSTAFLDPYEHVDFKPLFDSLRERIRLVTRLPRDMIWSSEDMQVIRYREKQHYHCHYDSDNELEKFLPCCHQVESLEESEFEDIDCIPCRYLTFFYYLNEPTLGGETAFPIADNETAPVNDNPKVVLTSSLTDGVVNKCDLSDHCYDANLYYKPKRGTALFWYNHLVNEETGWLGPIDLMSYHGGCDVLEGTKWAANNWINAGNDRETDLKVWEISRLVEKDFQERMERYPWEEQTRGEEETPGKEETLRKEETHEKDSLRGAEETPNRRAEQTHIEEKTPRQKENRGEGETHREKKIPGQNRTDKEVQKEKRNRND